MMQLPFVSAIMPTTERRREFARLAQIYFDRQSYPADRRELIVVDGEGSIGTKRNAAIARSRRGSIIIHWDDDDWHHPDRIAVQVQSLLQSPWVLLNGMNCGLFWWPADRDRLLRYSNSQRHGNDNPYVMGGTMCYYREWWNLHPFRSKNVGEDNAFLETFPRQSVEDIGRDDLYVVIRHQDNTGQLATENRTLWQPVPMQQLYATIGDDMGNYTKSGESSILVRLSHPYRRHRGDEPTPQAGSVIAVTPEELAYLQSKKHRRDEVLPEVLPTDKPSDVSTSDVSTSDVSTSDVSTSDQLEELGATPIENTKALSLKVE